jgi:hypothetical protein
MTRGIIIMAIVGAAGAGLLGLKWLGDARGMSAAVKHAEQMTGQLKQLSANSDVDISANFELADEAWASWRNMVRAAWLLVIGAIASGAATYLLHKGKLDKRPAAATWLASSLLPAFFAPVSLVFSFLLVVAGGMTFMNQPEPAAA